MPVLFTVVETLEMSEDLKPLAVRHKARFAERLDDYDSEDVAMVLAQVLRQAELETNVTAAKVVEVLAREFKQ